MRAREVLLPTLRSAHMLRLVIWAWRLAVMAPALRSLWLGGVHLAAGHYWQAGGWLTVAVVLGAIGMLVIQATFKDLQQMADRRMYLIDCKTGNVTTFRRR